MFYAFDNVCIPGVSSKMSIICMMFLLPIKTLSFNVLPDSHLGERVLDF